MKVINSILLLVVAFGCNTRDPYEDLRQYARRTFFVYPSTLHMLNVQNDPGMNEIAKELDELVVMLLNDAILSSEITDSLKMSWQAEGFEEYINGSGKLRMALFGKETRSVPEFIGLVRYEGQAYGFYIKGEIPLQKLPGAITAIQGNELLSTVFSMPAGDNENDGNRNPEQNPQTKDQTNDTGDSTTE